MGGLRSLRKVRKEQTIWRDSKPLERQVVLKCQPCKGNASDLEARHWSLTDSPAFTENGSPAMSSPVSSLCSPSEDVNLHLEGSCRQENGECLDRFSVWPLPVFSRSRFLWPQDRSNVTSSVSHDMRGKGDGLLFRPRCAFDLRDIRKLYSKFSLRGWKITRFIIPQYL